MIEDPELRASFQEENEERISSMEACFNLIAQNEPTNAAAWDELMRDVHSLKGSTRMLNIHSIELLSHHLEDLLSTLRKDPTKISSSQIKFFLELLDAIKLLILEETEGTESQVDVSELIKKISGLSSFKPQEKKEPKSLSLKISTIRVQIDQINKLMALATEMSISRTQMEHLFEQIEELVSLQEDKKTAEFEEKLLNVRNQAYDHIHKLQLTTSSLVDGIRKLSLIPISKLFALFPSMVREIAERCHKEIHFVIESEEIGVDRKIIEELKDPLMHLIRNAISHGIETAEERKKSAKPEKGLIELRAKQTEKAIIIEVADDGAGINLENIKKKALALKLFSEEALQAMSPEELKMILFMPGFSTAQQTSDISGRGVGLDVVQSAIQKLSGSLHVKSSPGHGATFTIELPISFVTTQVILLQEKERAFAVPLDLVEDVILVSSDQIFTLEGQAVIYVREEPYEVFFLHDLLFEKSRSPNSYAGSFPCLIFNPQDKKFALFVEVIIELQELVLVPANILPFELNGLVGLTILKNGEICLVFNPRELIQSSERRPVQALSPRKKIKLLVVDDSSVACHLKTSLGGRRLPSAIG